jgi:hypothetical protein
MLDHVQLHTMMMMSHWDAARTRIVLNAWHTDASARAKNIQGEPDVTWAAVQCSMQ